VDAAARVGTFDDAPVGSVACARLHLRSNRTLRSGRAPVAAAGALVARSTGGVELGRKAVLFIVP
jgi:hypothetical protein